MEINPILLTDFYKISHGNTKACMYPVNTTNIYSNLTPRKSRMNGVNEIVVFGIQYFILEYLIEQWNKNFFWKMPLGLESPMMAASKKENTLKQYSRIMDFTMGPGTVSTLHLEKLHDLGYLPLKIKALPEGTLCPIGVPCLTITISETHDEIPLSEGGYAWLVNYLETILSCTVWQPITSATIAHQYKKLLNYYAKETTGSIEGVQWQGHDFSMRGMSSLESACTSGAGHLLSFTGTDTIPAICFLEQFYGANVETEIVGASVPATEHSVMCMGTSSDEIGTFKRLLGTYPSGILSVVSDTWDLWKVLTEYLPILKDEILTRNGKLVIRPDSGDPVDIICGTHWDVPNYETYTGKSPESKGVIELLWDTFGGTVNEQGYKVLDPHIGAIYGDSITLARAEEICERLKVKGFASTNIVLGIGSFTYQYNTRDTFGFAVKATYGELINKFHNWGTGYSEEIEAREIFKDPITDDGTKKSKKGLLRVDMDSDGKLFCTDQCSKEQETGGLLEVVFLNGELTSPQTLSGIRDKLASYGD